MIEDEPLELGNWDDWFFVLAKFPKRKPRKNRVLLPPPPERTIPEAQKQMIIDLIRASKQVIGVDAKLLIRNN